MTSLIVLLDFVCVPWCLRRFAPRLVLRNYAGPSSRAALFGIGCLLAMAISGIWSSGLDIARFLTAITLYATGLALNVKALRDNPFFHPDIIAPPRRVKTGSYAYLSHPGYLAFSLRFLAFAYLVNTLASLVIFITYVTFLLGRAMREERILQKL